MNKIQRFEINTTGRDFAVGDVHGHFTRLQAALDAAGFDPAVDRLFSVGDLVDRGPESLDADDWLLRKPWFHAIRGNHEQMAIESYEGGKGSRQCSLHFINGGAWFYALSSIEQGRYSSIFSDLPLLIEVQTATGRVGLVHADCPCKSWPELVDAIELGNSEADHLAAICQWSRHRLQYQDRSVVEGVRAVVAGHTPLRQVAVLGNVYHIDTAGWLDGHFTLLNLATLECIPPINPKIHWDWEA